MRESQASQSASELADPSPHFTTSLEIIPVSLWNHLPSTDNRDGLGARSDEPLLSELTEEYRIRFRQLQAQFCSFLERVVSHSRVLIVEGISGSGKDTFQTYLKAKLEGRDVHDYSEGEVLHSWKQLQIEGIFNVRVRFMKLFVNYVRDTVHRDGDAVFLLNRFHLSTYMSTIVKQPDLESEYDEIINVLRTLPVHIFILQVDEHEIEQRSLHPERSSTWQKHQRGIVKEDGFRDGLRRHIWQQQLLMEAAKIQQIPYSVIKFPCTRAK
jgi:thymidylate kinase